MACRMPLNASNRTVSTPDDTANDSCCFRLGGTPVINQKGAQESLDSESSNLNLDAGARTGALMICLIDAWTSP